MIDELNPLAAHERLQSGEYVYLDVRTVEEFVAGRPTGALNIPIGHMDQNSGRMVANPDFMKVVETLLPKDAKIIVGCKSGGRSASACQLMDQVGYQQLWNVVGGFLGKSAPGGFVIQKGWSQLGLPTEVGSAGENQAEKTR